MRFLILATYLAVLLQLFSSEVGESLSCQVDQHNACVCAGNNFTVDLGAAFTPPETSQNVTDKSTPGNSYVISPCVDFPCGGKPSRVCEWDARSEVFNVIGTAEEVIWNVASIDNFSVTFGKGAPIYNDHIRNARISCTTGKPKYSFDGEGNPSNDNPLVYSFSVQAESFNPPMPVPSPSPTPPKPNPDGILMYIILVILAMVLGLLLLLTALVLLIVRKIYSTPAATVSGLKYKQLEPHDT